MKMNTNKTITIASNSTTEDGSRNAINYMEFLFANSKLEIWSLILIALLSLIILVIKVMRKREQNRNQTLEFGHDVSMEVNSAIARLESLIKMEEVRNNQIERHEEQDYEHDTELGRAHVAASSGW